MNKINSSHVASIPDNINQPLENTEEDLKQIINYEGFSSDKSQKSIGSNGNYDEVIKRIKKEKFIRKK